MEMSRTMPKMTTSAGRSKAVFCMTCLLSLLLLTLVAVETSSSGATLKQHPHQTSSTRTSSDLEVAAGTFLVADRSMNDPRFRQTVILMVRHDARGSAGIVINRPSELKLSHLFPDREEKLGKERFIYQGGPVAMQEMTCLMRLRNGIAGAERIFGNVYITSSRSVLEGLIEKHNVDDRFRVYAGYAGWVEGQLAAEIARGKWKVMSADAKYLFDVPAEDIWSDLMRDKVEGLISI
jgi:putative transcriptional regulator